MENNLKQVTNKNGNNLPIISDNKEVQRNSMRLYVYLVSISQFNGKDKPRVFSHRDFSVNKIRDYLGMHPTTTKKYWQLLEQHSLIKYEGPKHYDAAGDPLPWDKEFMARKKDGATYYSIPKKNPYRIMPRETLNKIQSLYAVTEQELKLYLMLAEMQERFCYLKSTDTMFSVADLRGLLKLSKSAQNNRTIINGLIWLRMLGLVEYDIIEETSNLGKKYTVFKLISVNYYTKGGEAAQYMNSNNERISEKMKEDLINNQVVDFFEE